jgi:cation diffusion facilitator family transporter
MNKQIFSKINIYKTKFITPNNYNLIFNRSISNVNNNENPTKKASKQDQLELQRKYENRAITVTKIGVVSNILLAGSKSSVGYLVGSTGLVADGVNSLGDLLCDAVVYYTLTEARKGVSKENPWGRGKVEPIGALTVSGLLLATGIGIGYTAIEAIYEALPYFHSIDTDVITQGVDEAKKSVSESGLQGAMLLSGLSLFVKEYLFRINLESGTNLKSSTMIANAWQHRADVGVSAGVFLGLGGSLMGYPLLDPLAGLFVAGVIVKQSVSTGIESLKDLSDSSADMEEVQDLSNSCLEVPGIKSIEAIQARRSGPYLYVEVTVGVPGNISASAAHR